MTSQKLWVLKAHTKTNRINDFCQNVRQDFVIYRNIDHQKAKKLEKKQRKKEQDTQTNKRSNKQANAQTKKQKTNKQCRLFFFGPMQWLEPLRVAKRNK